MEFRRFNDKEYERSKALWLACFEEDNADFVDLYYSARSKPEYVLGAFENGSDTAVAMLHMIPVKMRFGGKEKTVAEIAGVCTKPEYRNMGICSALLDRACSLLREDGFAAAALCPFDTSFYERLGFRTYIRRQLVELSGSEIGRRATEQMLPDAKLMAEIYAEFTSRFDGCTIRDEGYFDYLIREYSLNGARLVLDRNGCCAGYEEDGGETFAATELFFRKGANLTELLPTGYRRYVFPLPLGYKASINADRREEGFAMIKPLREDFSYDSDRCYGFDRY